MLLSVLVVACSFLCLVASEMQRAVPNGGDFALTNEGAHAEIVSVDFSMYSYFKNKKLSRLVPTVGHGLADDGSPIPANAGYEGSKKEWTIEINFFGKIYKTHYNYEKHLSEKILMGIMKGLDKQSNIVFVDGHVDDGQHTQFGVLMVACGLEEKIVDFHMHSGNDARITVHHPSACNKEVQDEYKNTIYENKIKGQEEKAKEEAKENV